MKQERIQQLLKGTQYDGVYLNDDLTPWVAETHEKISAAIDRVIADAVLNAALVQLLAKVLRDCRDVLDEMSKEFDFVDLHKAVINIDAALAEAGIKGTKDND